MSKEEKLYLEVSKEFAKHCQGFSMDIGGSDVKITYLHKDEWQMQTETTTPKIRNVIFAKEDFKDALQFVKDNCHIRRDGNSKPRVYMTGAGCQQLGPMIEKQLDIKITMLWEQGFVVKALRYLSRACPQIQFEHSSTPQCKAEMLQALQGTNDVFSSIGHDAKNAGSMMKPSSAESLDLKIAQKIIEAELSQKSVSEIFPDFFPSIRFQISSASGLLLIYPDGTYRNLSAVYPGGRCFLGLGQIICGSQTTYDELIDMAENGSNLNVDQSMGELIRSPSEDADSSHPVDLLHQETAYVLGKTAARHPDTFKKEDLIRGMLHMFARFHAAMLQNMVLKVKVKHVVVAGSFFNRQLVRSVFAQEFVRQKVMLAGAFDGEGLDVHLHFVKMCAYLGNLGAIIASTEDDLPSTTTCNVYTELDSKMEKCSLSTDLQK